MYVCVLIVVCIVVKACMSASGSWGLKHAGSGT